MGSRLSLFSRPVAKTDDKEVAEEMMAEVTPKSSEPTPITSDRDEGKVEPKCQCVDCKCDPCNCHLKTPSQGDTPTDTHTAESPEPEILEVVAEVTQTLSDVHIVETPNEVVVNTANEEPSKEVVQTEESAKEEPQEPQPEVPRHEEQVQEVPKFEVHEELLSSEGQEVQQTPEEVRQESSTENKCLCGPSCRCDPCKCGAHEVTQSEGQPQQESQSQEELADPQTESQSQSPQENAEQTQTEPKTEEHTECVADVEQIADPELPPEVSEALDLQINEQ